MHFDPAALIVLNVILACMMYGVALSLKPEDFTRILRDPRAPLNFAFYGWLNPHTRALVADIALDPFHILLLVAAVLALPLMLGTTTARHAPRFAERVQKPLRTASLFVLLAFVGIAFAQNMDVFLANANRIVALVIGHNTLALSLGALAGYAVGLNRFDRRAVTMEVGIQNSGLGLSILFTFFPQASGMILIAAFWGTWHLISGLALAMLWARSERIAHA